MLERINNIWEGVHEGALASTVIFLWDKSIIFLPQTSQKYYFN